MTSQGDLEALSLLHLAEGFRISQQIQSCVQCLLAIPNLNGVSVKYQARAAFLAAKMMHNHCPEKGNPNREECIKIHLEKAIGLAQGNAELNDIMMDASSMLGNIHIKNNQIHMAVSVLRKGLELSNVHTFYHCKLLFQLSNCYARKREYTNAGKILSTGADYAHSKNAQYTRILFLLSKGMMLMIDRNLTEVRSVLNVAGQLVETWAGSDQQKESLKIFFLVLQVSHHLNAGQVKSVKQPLKLLQQSIQNISGFAGEDEQLKDPGDQFQWMQKEHMCILVYLVTVLHSMQAGHMDKVQKYSEKALAQIEKLRAMDDHLMLTTFQLLLLEHMAMCRLVVGNRNLAIKETVSALQISFRDSGLHARHLPVIHTLLGLYAMSMNQTNEAESQLTTVLRNSNLSVELRILASLNLCIVYLRMNKEMELNDLLNKMNPEHFPSQTHSLKTAAYFVMGLKAFVQGRFPDAKRFLRESLKMGNQEDLNRLTSCSLSLLGHIFYCCNSTKEAMNMVTPAMQLAQKIPDLHIQLWTTALLKDLYRMASDPVREQENISLNQSFRHQSFNDQMEASNTPEHQYISWLGEDNPTA